MFGYCGNLDIRPFASSVFPAPRKLRVLLPQGYRTNRAQHYPALYLNDGQNLFDACTSIFGNGEWRVDEAVATLVAEKRIAPLIVVGVDTGGRQLRPREYLPWPDETLKPEVPDPQGRFYPKFLLDEVVPYVENHYRVLPGAEHRAIGGSSYGAGIALYTVIQRPGSFGGLLLEIISFGTIGSGCCTSILAPDRGRISGMKTTLGIGARCSVVRDDFTAANTLAIRTSP